MVFIFTTLFCFGVKKMSQTRDVGTGWLRANENCHSWPDRYIARGETRLVTTSCAHLVKNDSSEFFGRGWDDGLRSREPTPRCAKESENNRIRVWVCVAQGQVCARKHLWRQPYGRFRVCVTVCTLALTTRSLVCAPIFYARACDAFESFSE